MSKETLGSVEVRSSEQELAVVGSPAQAQPTAGIGETYFPGSPGAKSIFYSPSHSHLSQSPVPTISPGRTGSTGNSANSTLHNQNARSIVLSSDYRFPASAGERLTYSTAVIRPISKTIRWVSVSFFLFRIGLVLGWYASLLFLPWRIITTRRWWARRVVSVCALKSPTNLPDEIGLRVRSRLGHSIFTSMSMEVLASCKKSTSR